MMPVPKIIAQQFLNGSTGILVLRNLEVTKTIHFELGTCRFATSSIYEDRLGERLMQWGVITEFEFSRVSEAMKQKQLKFGQALVQLQLVEEQELFYFLQRQLKEIIFSTFTTPFSEHRFDNCLLPEYELPVYLNTPQIILEGMRRIDELEVLQKFLPNWDVNLSLAVPPQQIHDALQLEPQEAYIVSLLESTAQSIRKILSDTSLSQRDVLATVYTLTCLNFLEESTPAAAISVSPEVTTSFSAAQEPDSEIRKLQIFCYEIENKIAAIDNNSSYYELLEISIDTPLPEIRRAYNELYNKFNPSRQAELSKLKIDMLQKLERISKHLTKAVQTLVNPEAKRAYDQSLLTATSGNGEISKLLTSPDLDPAELEKIPSAQPEKLMSKAEAESFCTAIDAKIRLIKSEASYYQILELPYQSDSRLIEQAYLSLMEKFALIKQMHLSPYGYDKRAELDQIRITLLRAYNTLSDPRSRTDYDRKLSSEVKSSWTEMKPIAAPSANRPASGQTPSGAFTPPATTKAQVGPIKAQPVPIKASPAPTPPPATPSQAIRNPNSTTGTHSTLPQSNTPIPGGKSRSFEAAEIYLKVIEAEDASRIAEAVALMRKVVSLVPKDPHYWAHLGRLLASDPKAFLEAESAIKEAIKLDPKDPDYYAELGSLYRQHNRLQEAIRMFEHAIQINPQHSTARKALAELKDPNPDPKPKTGGLLRKFGL